LIVGQFDSLLAGVHTGWNTPPIAALTNCQTPCDVRADAATDAYAQLLVFEEIRAKLGPLLVKGA